MNDKNNALFFNEDNDFNAVITLTDEDGNDMDMEADGNPVFESLDDPEEFEIASAAFEELIAEMAQEEDDDDDDEEDDGNIGYLDDISDIIPGVSIDLDN